MKLVSGAGRHWPSTAPRRWRGSAPVQRATLIPVVLFDPTALTDRQGRTLPADDIYRLDPALLKALHGD